MYTKLITLSAGLVLTVAGLGSGASAAPSACPEARAACQPIGARPAGPDRRASFQLVRTGSGPCGPETFAIVANGQRKAVLC
jgi:hypothetical protein